MSQDEVGVARDPSACRAGALPVAPGRRGRAPTGPLRIPGVRARTGPFVAVAVVAIVLALLPPTSSSDTVAVMAAAAVFALLVGAAAFVPWGRLPDWCQASVPLGYFVVVALLRHAGGGAVSGFSALVMLPILWMAIYASRTQLVLALVGTVAIFIVPLIVVGSPSYPSSGWRAAALWALIGLLAGSVTQTLVDHSRQRTADVAALGAVTRALTAGADPRPELCAAAQLVTGAAFAVLFEPRPDGTLAATASTGGIELEPLRTDPEIESSATAEVWRTGHRIYVADAARDPRASARLAAHTGAVAVLFQPVTRDGRRTAVLVVGFPDSRPRLPAQAVDMVELVAAEIAAAIDRADLVALLEAQARTDPLTGAANRRSWDEVMDRELARFQRTGAPLAVALVDMDHFKAYNDTFGHGAGDVLLSDLVAVIRAELRTGDVIARWGGEEFALALPACDLGQAQAIAERLLRVVPSGQTASIGLTQAGADDSPRSVIARADRALYAAKDNGRDQVSSIPWPLAAVPTPLAS